MAWTTALASQYGYNRVFYEYPQEVLEQQPTRRLQPVFQPPPALVDKLRQQQMKWWPYAMDNPRAFEVFIQQPPRRLLRIFQPPPINYPTRWRTYLDNWAAVGRLDDVLYVAKNQTFPEPIAGPSPSWAWQLANIASINRLDTILYLIQAGTVIPSQPAPPLPSLMPWVTEQTNWASIGRLDNVVYWARYQFGPTTGESAVFPVWKKELVNWAALIGGTPLAIQLAQPQGVILETPKLIPPTRFELVNLAAIHYKQQILYLVSIGSLVIGPSAPVIAPPIIAPLGWSWRQYYTDWPQLQIEFRLPSYITLPGPPPVIVPVPQEVSCFTIEAPPTSTLFALADTLQASLFITETGLLVMYTGESPHICFN